MLLCIISLCSKYKKKRKQLSNLDELFNHIIDCNYINYEEIA